MSEPEDVEGFEDDDVALEAGAPHEGPLVFITPSGALPERIDKLLAEHLKDVTRAQIQRWIEEGRVLVQGRPVRAKDKLGPGTRVELTPGPEPRTEALPDSSVPVLALYEDDDLVVVSKPAGLVVHPGRGHRAGTLVNGLLARPGFERPSVDPRDPEGQLRPGIVHRIDKDTSGILVVAKTALAREGLKEQFAAHSIERVYRALTVGVPRAGRVDTWHGRDPSSRLRFSSKVSQGKRAVTFVQVLEVFGGARAALVECRLETGRTHQIRVHASQELGTPLLADELYGGLRGPAEVIEIARDLGRQALHAAVLGFRHPRTGEGLRFEEPLPADFERAIAALRALPRS